MGTDETLEMMEADHHHLSMSNQMSLWPLKRLHFTFLLLCLIFGLTTCGPSATRDHLVSEMIGMQDPFDYEECRSYRENLGGRDFFVGEISPHYIPENSPTSSGLNTICTNSDLFCFPSTLPGFWAEEENYTGPQADSLGNKNDAAFPEVSVPPGTHGSNSSWFSNHGSFILLNEKIVSCSMMTGTEFHDMSSSQGLATCGRLPHKHHRSSSKSDEKSELIKSDFLESSSSPKVEISPRYMDWGQNYLYFPSAAFLTVANTCNESILHIYEPFSTNTQFYPCNFDEVSLGPGEVASICFVFLPQQLGLSSARLVLQTSSGGFLVQAKGMAAESLYRIQPLVGGVDISSDGTWIKNLSLYNPSDDILYIKEVAAWILVSSENTSHSTSAVCKMDNFQGIGEYRSCFNGMEWLNMKSDEVDMPVMAIRPHKSWEIYPRSAETIMEISFLSGAKEKISGAFSMQLQSSSPDRIDTVVVPLEVELPEKADYRGLKGSVSVYLQSVMPCDRCETAGVILSVRNRDKYLLKVANVSEDTESTKIFHIKYMDGLLLFPDTVTEIAVVTYSCPPSDPQESPREISKLNSNCKLLLFTNDSGSPVTEVSCQDVVQTCMRHPLASYVGERHQNEKSNSASVVTGALASVAQSMPSAQIKLTLEIAEADEMVLRSWMSQGTTGGMSVLDDDEVLFPVVPVGSHCSKWISVRNPSAKPVVMQLILNSGAVVDQCKPVSEFLQQPLSRSLVQNGSTGPTEYGFSIAENALTEAYIHPHGKALLGPIVFHPSSRCGWRSSALIRNNLSGVEWLPLHGSGGSLSLALFEGSMPVQSLEFNLNLPIPRNISPQGLLFFTEDSSAACSVPVSKELYAMNTGDLPLEVRKIEVSGTNCGLDGFMVHNCVGFALEPGESRRLPITFQSDYSAAMVHRDLELALDTGIFVIPMKASLPVYMLTQCRKSFFWILLKRFTVLVMFAAFVTFLVSCRRLPQVMSLGTHDYLFKTENGTISRTKKPFVQRNQKNSRVSMYNNVGGMIRSVREDETSKLGFVGRYSDCPSHTQELRRNGQSMRLVQNVAVKFIGVLWPKTEAPMSALYEAKSLAHEPPLMQAPETGNLTVRVSKEKSKRRRKRKSGAGTGFSGRLEVSSSQSGNSTPSSPRSPATSLTPKRSLLLSPDVDHLIAGKNPFTKVVEKKHVEEQTCKSVTRAASSAGVSRNYNSDGWLLSSQPRTPPPRKANSKAVLLPSATFPGTNRCAPDVVCASPFSPSNAAVSPHARAPGSNLSKQKTTGVEKSSPDDRFTYDIWGNHFSGFHLMGKVKEVSVIIPNDSGEDSQSFFAMGPQILMQSSNEKLAPPAPKMSFDDVTVVNQEG